MAEPKKGQGTNDAGQSSDAVFEDIFEHIDVDSIDTSVKKTKATKKTVNTDDKKKAIKKTATKKKETTKKAAPKKEPPVKKTPEKESTKKKVATKKADLDIDDISAYIASRKAQQEEKEATLTTSDGVDLRTLPDVYAVVPHVKGDHKLVYFHEQAPQGLEDDIKGRKA